MHLLGWESFVFTQIVNIYATHLLHNEELLHVSGMPNMQPHPLACQVNRDVAVTGLTGWKVWV